MVDADALPQTIAVVAARAEPLGIEVRVVDLDRRAARASSSACTCSTPAPSGAVRDPRPLVEAAHERNALVAVAADLLALTLLRPPGEIGADIAVGTTQRFGVPMGYGGPHAGYLAVRPGLERLLPGRLVGVSGDADGTPGVPAGVADPRAAHPPGEGHQQHLHRPGAAGGGRAMYAVYHGPDGLRAIAQRTHRYGRACSPPRCGRRRGGAHERFFDTVTARVPGRAAAVVAAARSGA